MRALIRVFSLAIMTTIYFGCSSDDGDGGGTGTPEPNITVTASDFTTTVDENLSAGQSLGSITASTSSGTLTYTLTSDSPSGALAVSSTGGVSVADETLFDAGTNPIVTGSVTVANGDITEVISITVNVVDVWSGATLAFSKADDADWTLAANQDRITELVWITRDNNGGQIFNAVSEGADDKAASPAGTSWALGTTGNLNALSFGNFRSIGSPKDIVGQDIVLRLDEENILIDISFTSWSTNKAGGFAYDRSTQN